MPDPEHILQRARERDWRSAWSTAHAAAAAGGSDRLEWALETLADAFFSDLAGRDDDRLQPGGADALETAVLMHSGGQWRLSEDRFRQAVERLVRHHCATGDRPAARRFARFRPGLPACAAVLTEADGQSEGDHRPSPDGAAPGETAPDEAAPTGGEPDAPEGDQATPAPTRRRLEHPTSDRIEANVVAEAADADLSTGLFRSDLERDFFHAARSVFPTYAPYPNVALTSVVDVEAVRPHLSGEERSLLYTGVVDCVLFDPHADYRPVAFFEIDSPYHDTPERQASDARKDRILAAAGHRLIRLRPRAETVGRDDFADFLRSLSRSWESERRDPPPASEDPGDPVARARVPDRGDRTPSPEPGVRP